jgi:pimeloyl-ACP methyl ester carboxylesterase
MAPERLRFVFAPETETGGRPHDQWPTSDNDPDEVLHSIARTSAALAADLPKYQTAERSVIVDFVKSLGRCVVVAHSAGGAAGLHLADALPDAIAVLVELEPTSPPFSHFMGVGALAWGLTAAPVAYDPPAKTAEDLILEPQEPVAGFPPGALQAAPARRLANISRVPIVVVTSETSGATHLDPQSVAFLRQAGCDVEHMMLSEAGVKGNGHAMMLELNNDQVLDAILLKIARYTT